MTLACNNQHYLRRFKLAPMITGTTRMAICCNVSKVPRRGRNNGETNEHRFINSYGSFFVAPSIAVDLATDHARRPFPGSIPIPTSANASQAYLRLNIHRKIR